MTKSHEIQDLIAEQSAEPAERKALEAVADRLEERLAQEVPYRHEFKARLRRQLLIEARRTLAPWYRRPAVWGSAMGMAAAVGILAVGLQLLQTAPSPAVPDVPPQVGRTEPPDAIGPTKVIPRIVNHIPLQAPILQDEVLAAGAPGPEPMGGEAWSEGLKVYLVSMKADADQFDRILQGLGFSQRPQITGAGFQVDEGGRSVQLTSLGEVTYQDGARADGASADTAGAQAAARRFLERAGLPIPSQPEVLTGQQRAQLTVVYTPRVENRPIINERTVIEVGMGNVVTRAVAYVQAAREARGAYEAISPDQAVKLAQDRGGRFEEADLVYVRTPSGEAVYLQPYWRVFGINQAGSRVARYVPALSR